MRQHFDDRLHEIRRANGIHNAQGGLCTLREILDRDLSGQTKRADAATALIRLRAARREAGSRIVSKRFAAICLASARMNRLEARRGK